MVSPKAIVCVGGGGHARVVMDAIVSSPDFWRLVGYTDPNAPDHRMDSFPYLGDDRVLETLYRDGVQSVILGVGSIDNKGWMRRRDIVDSLKHFGFKWEMVQHPRAYCSQQTIVGEDTVILVNAVVNAGTTVGRHCIINTGAIVEHDCTLGDWVHIAPGAYLGGNVCVGEGTHIGLGSRIREGIKIGRHVVVGLGSSVIRDIPDDTVVAGSPARILYEKSWQSEGVS